jgi:hypothetical protein
MSGSSFARGWIAACAVWGSACFTEPSADDPSATTGDVCEIGGLGCECFGNGTCDPGLACDPNALRCVPEGCNAGQLACACTPAGECDGSLLCAAGICESPDAGATTGGATDGGPVTTDATDADTTAGSTTRSGDTTTSSTASATDDATEDTGAAMCDALACEPCLGCADAEPLDCDALYGTCDGVGGCVTIANCMRDCGLTGLCFDGCCDGMSPGAISAAIDLALCRSDSCSNACSRYDLPTACN